jgi:hypothetical protein
LKQSPSLRLISYPNRSLDLLSRTRKAIKRKKITKKKLLLKKLKQMNNLRQQKRNLVSLYQPIRR